jgi:hypothetical protein
MSRRIVQNSDASTVRDPTASYWPELPSAVRGNLDLVRTPGLVPCTNTLPYNLVSPEPYGIEPEPRDAEQ